MSRIQERFDRSHLNLMEPTGDLPGPNGLAGLPNGRDVYGVRVIVNGGKFLGEVCRTRLRTRRLAGRWERRRTGAKRRERMVVAVFK